MIVELHILQNFAPSCLNRDDTNSPKECEFGGYRRARISSQCIKRSIREYFKDNELIPLEKLATRTKDLVKELNRRLILSGKPEDMVLQASIKAIESTGKLKLKDKEKPEYLLFLGEEEIASVVRIIESHWDMLISEKADAKSLETTGKDIINALNGGKAADLALYGRMLADLPAKNIHAACQVAHAISTNKVGVEFNFYTAMDDLKGPDDEPGAGMMGTVEYNSACLYRYANIDLCQLKENLANDNDLIVQTVESFIRASVNAIPTGKQNSFAAHNPPSFVFAVVRNSGAWSLANAFVKPVWAGENGDLVQKSTNALLDYWSKLVKVYGAEEIKLKSAFTLDSVKMQGITDTESLNELIQQVKQKITVDC
jgi:CRISPR system Cascade subunit CasC